MISIYICECHKPFQNIFTKPGHTFSKIFYPYLTEQKELLQGNITGARDSLCVLRQKVED